ncbi:MAG: DegV family protein [Ruminococcaceae bacterium]|nr:DegV family protein [Oscillospiraceae bacterium]
MSTNRKVRIIVDSAADIAESIADKLTILPMTLRFGDTEYTDGVDITNKEFYEKLVESDELPTTSQIMPHAFLQAYKEAIDAGEDVVVITISSKLSGTFQSACIAEEEVEGNIYVVDSLSAAIGEGILAELAVYLVDEGKSASEIATELEEKRENIRVIAMLNTLEYLKKGGRISKTVAFAGELLSIKPVVSIVDGEVNLLGKARGSKQANNLLVKEIENAGGVDFSLPLLLGYTGMEDSLLRKYVEDSSALWEGNADKLRTSSIGSIVGTHVGPGAVAVAFFKNN